MRLLIVIVVVGLLVLIDQYRFRGYYGSQLSSMVQRTINSITR
jgi:hypothetical protein